MMRKKRVQNDDDTNLRDIELSISWFYLKLHTDKALLIEIVVFDEQSTFWFRVNNAS